MITPPKHSSSPEPIGKVLEKLIGWPAVLISAYIVVFAGGWSVLGFFDFSFLFFGSRNRVFVSFRVIVYDWENLFLGWRIYPAF